jgi:parallel beta-helix repeat protein
VYSSPAVADGRVYVGSYYGDGGTVYCLDALTGAHIWDHGTNGGGDSSPAIADGRVYVGSDNGKVYCLDALTGDEIWNYEMWRVYSSPTVVDGRVYVGSGDGKVYCLDAFTGAEIWNYSTGSQVYSSPAVVDGRVYVGSEDGKVYCLDASTGTEIWNYDTGYWVHSSPAVADGVVYVGSNDNKVYAFGNVVRSEDYPTIQAAINNATAGATVIIAPGIYNESIVVNKTLTIIGLPGSAPTFNGGGSGIAITLLPGASGSTIAGIVITHFDLGILLVDCTNVKIYDNRISIMDYDGITLEGSNAANNIIQSNIFEQSSVAINLTTSAVSNTVYKNIIVSNNIGHSLESTQNTITANTIAENKVGIDLSDSSNNVIYHNNFINNDIQVSVSQSASNTWDDGYPSGGNFWSICSHIDLYKGSDQNQPGSDSINDTEYMIDTLNIDRYPLVQPFSPHDIGVANIILPKTILGQGSTMDIELEIINYGTFDETFIVTIYANTATIATRTVTLTKRNSTAISVTWNTAGFTKGEYTITAYAWPIQSETDTTDNSRTGGKVIIAMPGDITGFNGLPDGKVDMKDISKVAKLFGVSYPNPKYDANCDIMYDLKIDMKDISFVAKRFGQVAPP